MSDTIVASDNFNRADSGSLGSNWLDLYPSWATADIASNEAVAADGSNEQAARWAGAGSFSADQFSRVTIKALSFQNANVRDGVVFRASGDQDGTRDYYAAFVELDSAGPNYTTVLAKVINGTQTVLHSGPVAWSVGDQIQGRVVGTTLELWKNGALVSGFSVTDSALSTGVPGIYVRGDATTSRIDDWEGGNIDTAVTASVSGVTDAESVPTIQAAGGNNTLTITLKSSASTPLANTTRNFWTRNSVSGAAIDGGTPGLSATTNSSGQVTLTGLSIASGARWLTYKDPSDDLNCHSVPVTI